jgi:hypothetical protein
MKGLVGGGMGKFHPAAKIARPAKPMKVHPPQQPHIRVPQGSTGGGDPQPSLPDIGKI